MKKYKTNFPIYGNMNNPMNQMNGMDGMYDINDMYGMYNINDMYNMNEDYNDNYMPDGIYMPNIMPEMEETNKAFEEDMAYMKEMYPDICKRIQKYIDEECDKMDYEGSYLYDDYPDKEIINIITDKIYDKIDNQQINSTVDTDDNVVVQRNGQKWCTHTIKVMLLNEIYRRRRKRCKKYCNCRNYYKPYRPYKPRSPQYYYTNPYRYY